MRATRQEIVVVVSIELLSIMVWGGGLVALGAVAAPLVFGIVPAPTSADAMTQVFLRFDRVAMTCAAIALVAESALGRRAGPIRRPDALRLAALSIAAAFASVQGAWLSPKITELHRGGAVRGLGDAGLALEEAHRWSERLGKTTLVLLAASVVLVVVKACTLQNEPSRS
jgi:hypothetical protein